MELFCLLAVLPYLLNVLGNVSGQNDTNISSDSDCVKVTEASNLFGLRLYTVLAQRESSFVICPMSLSSVLSMVYFGSRGDLATELNLTLGYDVTSLDETELLNAYEKTMNVLNTPHSEYQLNIANSMWVQESFQVEDDYKEIVSGAFASEIQEVNFSSKNATDRINRWVSENTRDKIPELFSDNLDSSTLMLLLNAIYFKGTWFTKFDPKLTLPGRFYHDGSDNWTETQMMAVSSSFRYYASEDLEACVVELPYSGHEISMLVILPNEGTTLADFEYQLTPQDLYSFISNMTEHKVQLTMPKFKLEKTLDLKETLTDMGLSSLFGKADLSGIARNSGLAVSDVLQKTMVEVNEEGSEAAAATAMIFSKKKTSGERFMDINRPFMFIIGHIPSGSMLFLGRVNEL